MTEAPVQAIVRFVAVGDTGKGNDAQRNVGQGIATICAARGCDFVVLLGDNFYPTGVSSTTDPQWESAFVEPYKNVQAPFYAVLGNHDYGGNGSGTEFDRGQHQVDYSKVNSKWRMPAAHYRWSLGPAEFFVADTNRSMFRVDGDARESFAQWLPASTASWKIAFGHHPHKSNGRHGNAGEYDGLPLVPIANGSGVKRFVEDHVCGLANVYICGHDHSMQWLKTTCSREKSAINTELLVSGAGASYTGYRDPQNEAHWQGEGIGFLYVTIDAQKLHGIFFDASGTQLFERSIAK